ncbi:hypothetical protein F4781DRAFT_429296 [Annulohypoxylon bovei var. microspora]|nr:hypothetical protein F4781DRAFT_429296 [Annulohypoxylon bovei var. microspora]
MRRTAQSLTPYTCKRSTIQMSPIINYRPSSSQAHSQLETVSKSRESIKEKEVPATKQEKKKTIAELDAELQRKMSGLSGDGGEAGVEYENGHPVAMKRSVRDNMFRYI